MTELEPLVMDQLDEIATEAFPGLVVRKDLLRRIRSGFGVPMFVIEFLLGKYCASSDPAVIEEGMSFVRETLKSKYVRPDERESVKVKIKQNETYEIIDKVKVRLVETHDKYWAELANITLDYVNIEESDIRKHERLVQGGVWAEVTLRYDDSYVFKGQNRPFFIERLRPIQVSNLQLDGFLVGRARFTRDEWIDFLLRTLGFESSHPYFTHRRKLLYLARLLPLIEKNFNLIELGPRGTGKSFAYQQVSPYCHLISGGQTTVAQMFVNLASGARGLVCLWDAVAFDEAAGIRFPDKNGINIMKGYMEDGNFARGSEAITAEGSIAFLGNIDGEIETIVRTSNLFYSMPEQMDAAFYDRLHFYLPGWELQKTRDDYYTDHFGLVSDFLAEVIRSLRKTSFADYPERHFRFGSHLTGRDQKAVRKTASGLIKLLHPDGEVTKDEVEEYTVFAMEMRRRVKEQLRKIAGVEYWDVNFSYRDIETNQVSFVRVPEMGGGELIQPGAMSPGSVYTIGRDVETGKLALFLLQTQISAGSGRLIPLGNLSKTMKEGIKTADAYLKANLKNLGISRDPKSYDFSVQAINLQQAKEGAETAVAFFIAIVSGLLERPVRPELVVLGEMSVQGLLMKVSHLTERLQLALEAGALRILVPSENKRDIADVPDEVLNKLQVIFYTDPMNAVIRAMGSE
ncbi:protease Lon-related BREX system protein BrxL [Candidatus Bipolaricaulota bacterium]